MATARETTDREEIREWVERNGGRPAQVEGTGGMLRIDFGEPEEGLEAIDWDRFFEIFEQSGLAFLYDPQGHMTKFIQARGENERPRRAAARGRRAPRKKSSSTGGRKKKTSSTGGRKKKSSSTGGRKKKSSSTGRKKSTSRKKSTGTGRKEATSRKKTSSAGGRKKSTSRKKSSTSGRKKSGGRKYGPKAGKKVKRTMHEMKRGQLRSGRSGKKVTSRKQAIAIGLSEARSEGAKVPRRRKGGRKKKSSR